MATGSNGRHENAKSPINGHDDGYKTARHPRWTRQETLVLIQAKKIAEERGRKGRKSSSSVYGLDNVEPKWDAVSSYCRRNGVDRGPVQCRKRWSNLLSDFKKIKSWDDARVKGPGQDQGECFWTMRSDLRRERRLPGFFDKEVYDVLDGRMPEYELALVTISVEENNDEDEMAQEDEENRNDLFSEFEHDAGEEIGRNLGKEKDRTDDKTNEIPSPVPISEMKYRAFHQAYSNQENKRQHGPNFRQGSEFQEGVKKRKQSSSDRRNADMDDDSLIKALERNTNMLNAHLEEDKLNRRFHREQKKEQNESLMVALSKITDALEKIANKL